MKHIKKDQTSCLKDNSKVVERTTRTRLIELDTINNNKNNSIREKEVNEMVLMQKFKRIHFEVYQAHFIPNQKDWSQMTKIMHHKIPTKILMQTIKRVLLKFKRQKLHLPSYPLGFMLGILEQKEGTPMDLIKHLAKSLRNIHR